MKKKKFFEAALTGSTLGIAVFSFGVITNGLNTWIIYHWDLSTYAVFGFFIGLACFIIYAACSRWLDTISNRQLTKIFIVITIFIALLATLIVAPFIGASFGEGFPPYLLAAPLLFFFYLALTATFLFRILDKRAITVFITFLCLLFLADIGVSYYVGFCDRRDSRCLAGVAVSRGGDFCQIATSYIRIQDCQKFYRELKEKNLE